MPKTLILLATHPRTGSTLVANAIQGLIEPKARIQVHSRFDPQRLNLLFKTREIVLVKTHQTAVNVWRKKCEGFCDLKVVTIHRQGIEDVKGADVELIYDLIEGLQSKTLALYLAHLLGVDKEKAQAAKDRIDAMNKRVEELKNEPFTVLDEFYHIHGSHRNRPKP